MDNLMGKMVNSIRVYYGFSVEAVSDGLCETSWVSKIESEDFDMDKLLFEAMIQRMGKPTRLYEYILDFDEYQLYEMRQNMRKSILNKAYDNAIVQACKYLECTKQLSCLHSQFAKFILTHAYFRDGSDLKKQLETTYDAIRITVPLFEFEKLDILLLSEVELLLAEHIAYLTMSLNDIKRAEDMYEALRRLSLSNRYKDDEMMNIFSVVYYQLACLYYNTGKYEKASVISREGYERITTILRYDYITELLKINVSCKKKCDTGDFIAEGEAILYQLEAFRKEFVFEECRENSYMLNHEYRVVCINDVIKQRRKLFGISQEELAFDVCHVTNLSRAECKKSSLHYKNAMKILEKLNISGSRIYDRILTGSYGDKRLYDKICLMIEYGRYDKAAENLKYLEKSLNNDFVVNCQALDEMYAILEYRVGECTIEELIERTKEIISYTIPWEKVNQLEGIWLSMEEVELLQKIATFYSRMGDEETSLYYARLLINNLDSVYDCVDDNVYDYLPIMNTWQNALGNLGLYEESNSIINEQIEYAIKHGILGCFDISLYALAWNFEQRGTLKDIENRCICLHKQAYTFAKICKDVNFMKHIKNHCEELYQDFEDLVFFGC